MVVHGLLKSGHGGMVARWGRDAAALVAGVAPGPLPCGHFDDDEMR